eukprot:1454358-Prymnesium_polylepis.1
MTARELEARRRLLVAADSLGFAGFLLSCRHPMLHKEACAALRASRAPFAAGPPACWPGAALSVPVDGEEVPLRELIRRLERAGSLTNVECAPLLED